MTRDRQFRQPAGRREPLDDAAIEQLIRDVAGEWTMPPIRLDAPSWRDRVRTPRGRRMAAAHGWLGRMGQAAAGAVALTVVAALVAIVVTSPPKGPASSADPSRSPGASPAARPSVLPKLLIEGELPSPSRVLVRTEHGDHAIVDLERGSLGGPIAGARSGSLVQRRTDGSLVCLCVSETMLENGRPTRVEVRLERYDRDGVATLSRPVEIFEGAPDPRDAGIDSFGYPPHVTVAFGFSQGGRYGFVGWSARAHPAWRSGVLVVDLLDGAIVSRLALPDVGTGEGTRRTIVHAPRVVGTAGAGEVLVARNHESWSSPDFEKAHGAFDGDLYRVAFTGGRLADAAAVPNTSDCGDVTLRAGALPDGGVWMACSWAGGSTLIVRRVDRGGGLQPDVSVSRSGMVDGDTTALSADGRSLFAWDPLAATLLRIDLETGEKATSRASGAGPAGDSVLRGLGAWLAPAVAAKSLLLGAVAVSPDGRRVYALGVTGGASERDPSGSSGVFVFDAGTLEQVDHWQPTADYASLATSADGELVFAAGLPGFDSTGRVLVNQAASITVFSAADGRIRLIAGQLGPDVLSFAGPVLD